MINIKKIYFVVDDDGYIVGGYSFGRLGGDAQSIEIDDNHEVFSNDPEAFKYEDGELIFDEKRNQELIEEREEEKNKPSDVERLEKAIMELAKISLN